MREFSMSTLIWSCYIPYLRYHNLSISFPALYVIKKYVVASIKFFCPRELKYKQCGEAHHVFISSRDVTLKRQ
jgi:hypothetical protein